MRLLTLRIEHHHIYHNPDKDELMAQISAAFQAQLDRLAALVATVKTSAAAEAAAAAHDEVDAQTAALASTLDAAGAPPAVEQTAEAPQPQG